jgi:hypothetical protein
VEAVATFCEVALALAGFAAIALVLGQREGAIPPGAIYIVRFMVINALGPALLSLLAIVLAELGMGEPALWRACSGVYVAAALFVGLLSLRHQRALSRAGELVFTGVLNASVWGGSFLAHAIELSNLLGYPAAPSAGLFLLGLWVLLAVAAVQFVALLFLVLR